MSFPNVQLLVAPDKISLRRDKTCQVGVIQIDVSYIRICRETTKESFQGGTQGEEEVRTRISQRASRRRAEVISCAHTKSDAHKTIHKRITHVWISGICWPKRTSRSIVCNGLCCFCVLPFSWEDLICIPNREIRPLQRSLQTHINCDMPQNYPRTSVLFI